MPSIVWFKNAVTIIICSLGSWPRAPSDIILSTNASWTRGKSPYNKRTTKLQHFNLGFLICRVSACEHESVREKSCADMSSFKKKKKKSQVSPLVNRWCTRIPLGPGHKQLFDNDNTCLMFWLKCPHWMWVSFHCWSKMLQIEITKKLPKNWITKILNIRQLENSRDGLSIRLCIEFKHEDITWTKCVLRPPAVYTMKNKIYNKIIKAYF